MVMFETTNCSEADKIVIQIKQSRNILNYKMRRVILIIALVYSLKLVLKLQNVVLVTLGQEDEESNIEWNGRRQSARAKFKFLSIYDFEQFKEVFNKHYHSIIENMSRKSLYISRALRAFRSTLKYKYNKSDHYLKVNQMSDWTSQEFQDILVPVQRFGELYDETTKNHELIEKKRYKRGILKDTKIAFNKVLKGSGSDFLSIDHRGSKCLTPVKDQGNCGSCYIFATLALYEWLYCKATGEVIDFSEQYAIDCGHRSGASGCQGGVIKNVVDFVKDYGLEIDQNYKNTNNQELCKYDPRRPIHSFGYIRPSIGGFNSVYEDEFEKHLKRSPIVVALKLNDYFFEYGGGVDDARGCDISRFHSVLLVGSGREDGKDYWLFRNSHGSVWGHNGHYKLNKNTVCIMMDLGYVIKDGFKSDIYENRNPNYEL